MAREKHIIDLTIGNFKRFHNFEVNNLGQFNLIVGDNNTGKTSFLEALLLDEDGDIFTIINGLLFSLHIRSNNQSIPDFKAYVAENFPILLNRSKEQKSLSVSLKKRI